MTSKSKGNSFERKISDRLSKRFEKATGLEKAFRRNIDSGSFFGGANARRTKIHDTDHATFGDIVCPDGFKYSLECKHYKTAPSVAAIISQKCAQWDGWIDQARRDAANAGKAMALIIKYNAVPEFVIVDSANGLSALAYYKGFALVALEDWLGQADETFF